MASKRKASCSSFVLFDQYKKQKEEPTTAAQEFVGRLSLGQKIANCSTCVSRGSREEPEFALGLLLDYVDFFMLQHDGESKKHQPPTKLDQLTKSKRPVFAACDIADGGDANNDDDEDGDDDDANNKDDDDADKEDVDDDADDEAVANDLDFRNQQQLSKMTKDEKKKFKIKKFEGAPIFASFAGYEPHKHTEPSPVPHNKPISYSIDFESFLLNKPLNNQMTVNISGGYVPDVYQHKMCMKMGTTAAISVADSRLEDTGEILGNICDYASLYPSVMKQNNLCQSSLALFGTYPVYLASRGQFANPFDRSLVSTVNVALKLNESCLPFTIFFVRPCVQTSTITKFINVFSDKRDSFKKEAKKFPTSAPEYAIANTKQLGCKLMVNTSYGIMKQVNSPAFQPLIASSITYFGRLALFRLFFFSRYFFAAHGINPIDRPVLYGDTDSLFLVASEAETEKLLSDFGKLAVNRGFMSVTYEKQFKYAIFLKKKSYVTWALDLEKRSKGWHVYTKGVLKSSQSQPARRFVNILFELFLLDLLPGNCTADDPRVERVIREQISTCFLNQPKDLYRVTKKLSKELSAYTKVNTAHILQLRHCAATHNTIFSAGHVVKYAHYKVVFPFVVDHKTSPENLAKLRAKMWSDKLKLKRFPMLERAEQEEVVDTIVRKYRDELRSFVGPLDPANVKQVRFAEKFSSCTLLIDDLVEEFSRSGFPLELNLAHLFSLDLKPIFLNLFTSLGDVRLFEVFCAVFLDCFQVPFHSNVEAFKNKIVPKTTKQRSSKQIDDLDEQSPTEIPNKQRRSSCGRNHANIAKLASTAAAPPKESHQDKQAKITNFFGKQQSVLSRRSGF